MTHRDGKCHGAYIGYHKNGFLRITAEYKNGKKDGRWMIFDEDGQLKVTADYKDGVMQR